jgi:hypothetical protein
MPFFCFSCHEVGHLQSHCKWAPSILGRLTKKWVRKSKCSKAVGSQTHECKDVEVEAVKVIEEGCLTQSKDDQAQHNGTSGKIFDSSSLILISSVDGVSPIISSPNPISP